MLQHDNSKPPPCRMISQFADQTSQSTSNMRSIAIHEIPPDSVDPASPLGQLLTADLGTLDPSHPFFDLILDWMRAYLNPSRSYTPRKFGTIEDEENWWSNPLTWPGDHLIAPETLPLLASLDRIDSARRSCIVPFSPESSEYGDENEEPNSASLSTVLTPASRPPRSSLEDSNSDTSTTSEETSEDSSLEPGDKALAKEAFDQHNKSDLELYSDSDSDSDSGSDSDLYVPAGPQHHTRPGPARRTSSIRTRQSVSSRPREYKSRKSRHEKPAKTRRPQLDIEPEKLKMLWDEQDRLAASTESPPSVILDCPKAGKGGQFWCPYLCAKSGEPCTHHSCRIAEIQRHMLTHTNIVYLCSDRTCGRGFSRVDALKRHLESSGKRALMQKPPTTVRAEGKDFQLVKIEWRSADKPKPGNSWR